MKKFEREILAELHDPTQIDSPLLAELKRIEQLLEKVKLRSGEAIELQMLVIVGTHFKEEYIKKGCCTNMQPS